MLRDEHEELPVASSETGGIVLSEMTRLRLGRQLQAMYEPVIDEPLDPRLAELMMQLDRDRAGKPHA